MNSSPSMTEFYSACAEGGYPIGNPPSISKSGAPQMAVGLSLMGAVMGAVVVLL
jgi:hypothetical protein